MPARKRAAVVLDVATASARGAKKRDLDEDYDALYVALEDDSDGDDGEDYDAVFISPEPLANGVISGTDYASAAGSIDVQTSQPRRPETAPPAVVIKD